ncbi:class F sortase [Yinghuangia soli]|uniref:Class F sortase n=1 Tax=Yinghuangia soli TaxID=2908204 RepID=A0AA41U0Y7_9ACTN|nr:class F sortase [Yinghuangia soli]MCF2529096.1 class F sortase [Yinghuangia soli]
MASRPREPQRQGSPGGSVTTYASRNRRRRRALRAAGVLALTASLLGGVALIAESQQADTRPDVDVAVQQGSPAPQAGARNTRGLPAAQPVRVSVPAIGVDAPVIGLGLQGDGSVEVPSVADAAKAGWYRNGPTPGEIGPAVLIGHLDTSRGPAVFRKLPQLQPGTEVLVARADGSSARFRVRSLEQVPKSGFPTERVYGDTDTAQLRLITCGGRIGGDGHWTDNVIVYADLVR